MNCKKKESTSQVNSTSLKKLLESKSNNLGLQFYMLPESDDFKSIPQDSSNPISAIRIKLGRMLFFDPSLSFDPKCKAAARTYSCASCHFADAGFQAGIRQSIAGGGQGHGFLRRKHPMCDTLDIDVQLLRTPSIVNCAYQEVQLWSGKFGCSGPNLGTDSLWTKGSFLELNKLGMQGVETQARVALEAHGIRMNPELILNTEYGPMFDSAFRSVHPNLKYRRFSMAKAIAAYERTVLTNQAPFQKWLKGDSNALTNKQIKGANIFFGKADCIQCHTGPALNSMRFEALGFSDMEGPDLIEKKDAPEDIRLGRAGFTHREEDKFKFKVPQLYNLKNIEFLGHGGNFCSVREVISYLNDGKPQNEHVDKKHLSPFFKPLHLSKNEIEELTDFIENALFDPNLKRYEPTKVPSGFCFPNSDQLSRIQLGCTNSVK
ncbi:MAG: cytochrome c peroxidase [Saprospiraceae bacterium]